MSILSKLRWLINLPRRAWKRRRYAKAGRAERNRLDDTYLSEVLRILRHAAPVRGSAGPIGRTPVGRLTGQRMVRCARMPAGASGPLADNEMDSELVQYLLHDTVWARSKDDTLPKG